jgi:hypothetical protein
MGDTFQDEWEAPQDWRGWKLIGVDHTKWTGNVYRYQHPMWPQEDQRFEVHLRSTSPHEIALTGTIQYQDELGISVEAAAEFAPGQPPWWDDFDTAMEWLTAKLIEVIESAHWIRLKLGPDSKGIQMARPWR